MISLEQLEQPTNHPWIGARASIHALASAVLCEYLDCASLSSPTRSTSATLSGLPGCGAEGPVLTLKRWTSTSELRAVPSSPPSRDPRTRGVDGLTPVLFGAPAPHWLR
jgi:hypothetical protein